MLLLRNHLLPLLRAAASPLPRGVLLLSTASPAPFSLESYLVTACGLAPAQARRASRKALDEASRRSKKALEGISSSRPSPAFDPDAVLALLSGAGLSRADIAAVVAADPLLLRSRVDTLGPRLLALRDRVGLSAQQIASFLLVGSRALRSCGGDVGTKLEFFISLCGSFEQLLVVLKRNHRVLFASLERVIKPNVALLRQCGLDVRQIAQLCSHNSRVIAYSPERVKKFLLRAEELGVPCSSPMFRRAVAAVTSSGEEALRAKLEFFERTLGCSKTEASMAVSKQPGILGFSDECLLRKIEFLVNEVGMKPQYIVERPALLTLSLEKRLIPRHRVMKALEAEGVLRRNISLCTLAKLGENAFRLRFIECYKDSVPGLADAYAAACAGDVTPQVQI
ncbi:hypothetical protein ACP70R_014993 [Stipagrostis hirtigluma subsp. patula]